MVRKKENMEELIALYLNGESSPDDAITLEAWLKESPKNRTLYQDYEKTHSLVSGEKVFLKPDQDQAWQNINDQNNSNVPIIPLWKRSFYRSIAAVAVIVLLIGGLIRMNRKQSLEQGGTVAENPVELIQNHIITASNQVKSVTLSDQSIVELESGSKLTLDKDFDQKERRATLDGSGRFTVVHDKSKPFIINVDDLQVYDLGTIFDIRTKGDTVKVLVEEGSVELRLNSSTLHLEKGDSAFYVISKKVIDTYKQPEARQDKTFVFDGTNLKEVAEILSEWFNRNIVIMDKDLESCELSTSFKNKSLAEIITIIEDILDIEAVYNNNNIEFHGKSC